MSLFILFQLRLDKKIRPENSNTKPSFTVYVPQHEDRPPSTASTKHARDHLFQQSAQTVIWCFRVPLSQTATWDSQTGLSDMWQTLLWLNCWCLKYWKIKCIFRNESISVMYLLSHRNKLHIPLITKRVHTYFYNYTGWLLESE